VDPFFFGSVKTFLDLFPDPISEPKDITIFLTNADIHDWSGMVAIKKIHEKMVSNGAKSVKIKNLNFSSHRLMEKGKKLWKGIDIYKMEDVDFRDIETRSRREKINDQIS